MCIGIIYDMQQQIRIFYLLQCGAECLDQTMRQLMNKADCIGKQEILIIARLNLAHGRLQCRKKHILFQNLLLLIPQITFHHPV